MCQRAQRGNREEQHGDANAGDDVPPVAHWSVDGAYRISALRIDRAGNAGSRRALHEERVRRSDEREPLLGRSPPRYLGPGAAALTLVATEVVADLFLN